MNDKVSYIVSVNGQPRYRAEGGDAFDSAHSYAKLFLTEPEYPTYPGDVIEIIEVVESYTIIMTEKKK